MTRHVRARYERTRTRTRRQMRAAIVAQPDPRRLAAAITDAIAASVAEPSEPGVITGAQRMADDATIRDLECEFAGNIAEGHPESMAADLSDVDDEALAELAGRLWPHDEYAAIYREPNGGAS